MIPISLKIRGLYSYKNEVAIDFTRLCDAQLFGIFGPVGSGKSSILEAISFALYGDTERLNKSGDNRYYNMMNLGATGMHIDFSFLASTGTTYRFIVEGKRSRKNPADVKAYDRRAFEQKEGEWLPIDAGRAGEIIGLTYENFRRTIIIPQGRFQEFISMTEGQRTQMLKEIFQLQQFDIYDKARKMELENLEIINRLTGELNGLQEINEDVLKTQLEEYNSSRELLPDVEMKFKVKQDAFNKLKAIKDLADQFAKMKDQLAIKAKSKVEFESLRKKVSDYELCLSHFKDLIELINQTEAERDKAEIQLERFQKTKQQLSKDSEKKKNQFSELLKQYADEKQIEMLRQDWERILALHRLKDKALDLETKFKQGQLSETEKSTHLKQLKAKTQEQREQLHKLKNEKPDVAVLSAARNWFLQKEQFEKIQEENKQIFDRKKKEIENLSNTKDEILNDAVILKIDKEVVSLKITEAKGRLEEHREKYEQQQEILAKELSNFQVRQRLQEYAQGLQSGEPCPVCGSAHHPQKLTAEDVQQHLEKLQDKNTRLKNGIKFLNDKLKAIEVLITSYSHLKKDAEEAAAKADQLNKQTEAHQKTFEWDSLKSETREGIEQKLKLGEAVEKKIRQSEKALEGLEAEIEKAAQALEAQQKLNQKIELEQNGLSAREATLKEALQVLKWAEASQKPEKDITSEIAKLNKAAANFIALEKEISELETKLKVLENNIENKHSELKTLQTKNKEQQEKLDKRIESSSFENVGEVLKLLDEEMDVAAEKARAAQFFQELERLQTLTENMEEQLEKQPFDAETFNSLKEETTRTEQALQELHKKIAVLKDQLEKLKIQLKQKEKLEKEKQKREARGENIQTLKGLFKAQGFVNYVSTIYLRQLCLAADDRFRQLTRQSLSLEVSEDNNLQVRDYLNEGKTRSIKTLSGGQNFQASLCLALALADHVAQLNKAEQNFFFLDEGFGTLDNDSLKIVFETLKQLRKENRVVGIISHVEALQEEIDVHLRISKDPEEGSMVKGSWEI